jgi:hypothetical protein
MWCDPPTIPSADSIQPLSSTMNDKKQLSFVYQPGVGLYDKKKTDVDERTQVIKSSLKSYPITICFSLSNCLHHHPMSIIDYHHPRMLNLRIYINHIYDDKMNKIHYQFEKN